MTQRDRLRGLALDSRYLTAMTQPDRLREAAEWWHRQINSDPLLPDCSGTHMMGYGYCQRLAALATPAPDLLAAVEALREPLKRGTDDPQKTRSFNLGVDVTLNAVLALLRAAPSREATLPICADCGVHEV